jgi:hypothetical protein
MTGHQTKFITGRCGAEGANQPPKPKRGSFSSRRIRDRRRLVYEGLVCFLSSPPERLGRNGLEIAAVAAEGGHYNSTVLPDCWKCHAIFRLKTGGTYRAFKHDGRRMAAHSHVDTWIVEMHLTLLRQAQNVNFVRTGAIYKRMRLALRKSST